MKRSWIILLHTGYWTLYLLLVTCFLLLVPGQKHWMLSHLPLVLFVSPVGINFIFPGVVGFYVFYGFIFPKLLALKKILAVVFSGIITCGLLSLLSTLILIHLPNYRGTTDTLELATIGLFISLLTAIHGIIALVMRGFISWYADIKWKQAIAVKHFETELALVTAQLNPHFLFNSINNIDVLIMKDALRASSFLHKLSEMLRFMLYETKPQVIALEKELGYLDNYIQLQAIRTSNPDYVQYDVNIDNGSILIAPMLFIPFVENAFKHAAANKTGNVINIQLTVTSEQLVFSCRNQYIKIAGDSSAGIGNELIRKRLALLYPGTHTLTITDANNIYLTELTIQLHGH